MVWERYLWLRGVDDLLRALLQRRFKLLTSAFAIQQALTHQRYRVCGLCV